MKKILSFVLGLIVGIPMVVFAAGSIFTISQGGTGLGTAPTTNQILLGNVSGGYTLTDITGLNLLGFSTTSADYWKTLRNFFSTTSANNWSAQGLGFSTTSSDYWGGTKGYNTYAWPFTPTTNFNINTSATSTPVWFTNGLMSSSTSFFADASTTQLTVSNNLWFSGVKSPNNVYTGGFMAINSSGHVYNVASTSYIAPLFAAYYGDGLTNIAIASGNASQSGYIVNTDWSIFNNKQNAITATWPQILSTGSLTWGGLSTSSAPTIGNLPYWTSANTFGTIATGTITCAGTASCSTAGLSVIGGNLTVTGAGLSAVTATWPIISSGSALTWGGLATSSVPTIGNLSYWTGVNTFGTVATTTLTGNNGITLSASNGFLVGGSNATIGLATISQGVLGNGGSASAVPTSIATSTLFTGLAGYNAFFNTSGFLMGTSTLFTSTASHVGIATTSPSSLLQLFSTGTTTLSVDSNSASKGACIEMKNRNGSGYTYLYAQGGTLYSTSTSCK